MNSNKNSIFLLGEEKIKTALLKLGIPTMVGMLVSSLYNIVDAFFVGQLGTFQTAAVYVIYPLMMIGLGVGLLFGNGASSNISRALGKKDYESVKVYSSVAIITAMLTIVCLVGMMLIFFDPLASGLGATKASFEYTKSYGTIFIISLVFSVFNIMMNNLMVSEGGSSFGMIAMLVGGCFNLMLDPVLIFTCKLGVSGAAIATLVSSMVSTGMYIFYLKRTDTHLKVSFKYFHPTKFIYREIFKIGLPICLFQFLSGGTVTLTNIVAKPFGEAAIVSIGIANRIISLEAQALYGFLKGYSPLVGYNYGAKNLNRVKEATRLVICWSTVVNILLCIIFFVFSKELIHLFNEESSQVLSIGSTALKVYGISFTTFGMQIVIGNYFLAVGKAKQGGMLSISQKGLFFIPFLLIFSSAFGVMGIIYAQFFADICATIITIAMGRKEQLL